MTAGFGFGFGETGGGCGFTDVNWVGCGDLLDSVVVLFVKLLIDFILFDVRQGAGAGASQRLVDKSLLDISWPLRCSVPPGPQINGAFLSLST